MEKLQEIIDDLLEAARALTKASEKAKLAGLTQTHASIEEIWSLTDIQHHKLANRLGKKNQRTEALRGS